ncbi:MAG: hypothetical protein AAF292_13885 [Pseudomonadota bacterium]
MIRWFLNSAAKAFGKRYDYDTQYLLDIIAASRSAGLRISFLPLISQFRGPKGAEGVWVGALFASTEEGDCGPCLQLVVDMAIEAGIDPSHLQACREGRSKDAGDVGLGYRFANASIRDDMEADDLRREIEQKHGTKAVVSAAFAAALGRVYPVLKRGLGHGKTCERIDFRMSPTAETVTP